MPGDETTLRIELEDKTTPDAGVAAGPAEPEALQKSLWLPESTRRTLEQERVHKDLESSRAATTPLPAGEYQLAPSARLEQPSPIPQWYGKEAEAYRAREPEEELGKVAIPEAPRILPPRATEEGKQTVLLGGLLDTVQRQGLGMAAGAVGAGVGGYYGGPAGAVAGSLAGSLLGALPTPLAAGVGLVGGAAILGHEYEQKKRAETTEVVRRATPYSPAYSAAEARAEIIGEQAKIEREELLGKDIGTTTYMRKLIEEEYEATKAAERAGRPVPTREEALEFLMAKDPKYEHAIGSPFRGVLQEFRAKHPDAIPWESGWGKWYFEETMARTLMRLDKTLNDWDSDKALREEGLDRWIMKQALGKGVGRGGKDVDAWDVVVPGGIF